MKRGLVPAVIIVVVGVAVAVPVLVRDLAAAGRDPARWPFSVDSPWNTPVGSGAAFAPASDPRHRDLHGGTAYINAAAYSHPVYQARPTDPVRAVTTPTGTAEYRIPEAAVAAEGTDAHLHVVNPSKRFVDETIAATRDGGGYAAEYHVRNDLRGDGVSGGGARAYGGSAIAGLIRRWELEDASIRHALAFALPRERIRRGPVWPASLEDSDSEGTYRGSLPMGSFVAIPRSVDVGSLDLSPEGLAIARALQDYGAYLVDSADQFVLYAEPGAEPLVRRARADVADVRAELRVVTNNTADRVGGGGTPLAPRAPPLG